MVQDWFYINSLPPCKWALWIRSINSLQAVSFSCWNSAFRLTRNRGGGSNSLPFYHRNFDTMSRTNFCKSLRCLVRFNIGFYIFSKKIKVVSQVKFICLWPAIDENEFQNICSGHHGTTILIRLVRGHEMRPSASKRNCNNAKMLIGSIALNISNCRHNAL